MQAEQDWGGLAAATPTDLGSRSFAALARLPGADLSAPPPGRGRWAVNDPDCKLALFSAGGHLFYAAFREADEGEWTMRWDAARPVPAGSGLFPQAAAAVARATREFLEAVAPASLAFAGSDAKRNAFYARACRDWAPPGYEVQVLEDPDSDLADASGVAGIEFVRAAHEEDHDPPACGMSP